MLTRSRSSLVRASARERQGRGRWLAAGALLLAFLTLGCSRRDDSNTAGAATVRLPKVNRTFEPEQAVEQIDYAISSGEKVLATTRSFTERSRMRRRIIDGLLRRAQYMGDLSALDRAVELVDEMLSVSDEQPSKHLYHARVLSALHRYDEALAALDRAEAAGVKKKLLVLPRIRYLLNKGRPAEALAKLDELEKRVKSMAVVSTLAVTLADLGRVEAADRQFNRGLSAPTLIDPLPVAYLWFQQGLMYERQGQRSRARDYYNLAHARFPYYPALNSHLAALEAESGELDAAIARLQTLTRQSNDPDYLGQLGKLLRQAGRGDEADAVIARAAAGFETLLGKYPLAFADHAARFYLDVSPNPRRALELASTNLDNRQTDGAYQLYLDAAHAAHASAAPETCKVAAAAVARDHASAYALFAGARALRECGDAAGADAAMKRAKSARRQR